MITTICPVCRVECEHKVLREGAELVVQCIECDLVHRVPRPPEPQIITIKTIVSRETESEVCSVEVFDDEVVVLGDHIVAECEDEVIGVEITGIEVGDKRVHRAKVEEVATLWTRRIDQVVVRASVHSGHMTIPLYQVASGEDEFAVDEVYTFGGRRIRISHIKLRDGPVIRKEGWKTVARRIKRIYGRLEGGSRRR